MVDQSQITTKRIFGLMLPLWVDEKLLNQMVVTFVSIVIMLLTSVVFVWPRFEEIDKLRLKIDSLNGTIGQFEQSQAYLDSFAVKVTEADRQKLQLVLPNYFIPEFILASLRKLVAEAGVNLVSYNLKGGVVGGVVNGVTNGEEVKTAVQSGKTEVMALKPHQVNAIFSGDSRALVKLLGRLEQSYPYVIISKLTLSEVSKVVKSQGIVNLEMELTYYNARLGDVTGLKMESLTAEDVTWLNKIRDFDGPQVIQGEAVNALLMTATQSAQLNRGDLFGE